MTNVWRLTGPSSNVSAEALTENISSKSVRSGVLEHTITPSWLDMTTLEVLSSSTPNLFRKPKPSNPIENAIKAWPALIPAELISCVETNLEVLFQRAPKRWVVYPPMVLLPSGSFGAEWWSLVGTEQAFPTYRDELWKLILENITKREGKGVLTHLAINSGIPLHQTPNQDVENILRTPSGLNMLYGDFGPPLSPDQRPSAQDFKEAFWVSTKQNGITQIWAPRYTMFSRGNIKEKAMECRILMPSRRR